MSGTLISSLPEALYVNKDDYLIVDQIDFTTHRLTTKKITVANTQLALTDPVFQILTVNTTSLFGGDITANANASFGGNLTVSQDTTTNNLVVLQNETINGDLTTVGNVNGGLFIGNGSGLSGIPNTSLVNSNVTVGSTTIDLGSNSSVLAGLTSVTSTLFTGDVVGNVTGNVSGTALTVTASAQPAITSVGPLTGLTLAGNLAMGANYITGNPTFNGNATLTGLVAVTGSQLSVNNRASFYGIAVVGENTLTDAATITWNGWQQNVKVTLAASRTMAAISAPALGQFFSLRVIQGGTGSNTITWNSVFKMTNNPVILSTDVGAVDILFFRCIDGTNLECVGSRLNIGA